MAIQVQEINETTFEVTVAAGSTTTHKVTVDPGYAESLTGGQATTLNLVHQSFEFLLQREPNTSILSSFNLKVISRYFPEYDEVIKEMLDSKAR